MKNNLFLFIFFFTLITIGSNSFACHPLALVNYSVTSDGTSATVNASSDSPTCGCDTYWMDIEVRCMGEPFDAAPFNPGFWGPLNAYPYFQSMWMDKDNCVVQPYPSVTIPFTGLCPGVTYQVRARENHNGDVGPWTAPQTFTVPGTIPTLECEVQASNTTICVGDCVDLDAVITGGCGLAASYSWDVGTTGPPPPPAQCTFSICLYDTFGDGWNGGAVSVLVDGVTVLSGVTLGSGAGPVCFDFNVTEGQSIQVNYTAGSWSYENYYNIFDGPGGSGTNIFGTTPGQTPPASTNPPNTCGSGSGGGGGDPSISVCPTETTTYTVTITEDCSGQTTECAITINVLPPPIAGTAAISEIEICEGQTIDLSLMGYDGLIQWQSSPNAGGPWTTIGGATNDSYTSPGLTASTCYRAEVTGCGPAEYSNVVCVTVLPPGITALNCPAPLNAVCNISEQPPYATWNDFINAGGSVTGDITTVVQSSFTLVSEVSDNNSCPETITRTYEVTDNCGNTETCTQIITVNDIIAPTGNAPADLTVQCIDDVPAPDITSLTGVNDNCGVASVTHQGDVSNGTCPTTITRTYRITDLCGNILDVSQIITVDDTVNPSGTAPANLAVQCISDVPAPDINAVTGVSDNCGIANVTHEGDVSVGSCPEVITRTYRITDNCGNFIEVTQTITVNDDTAPTGNAPSDLAVQCASDVPAADITSVTNVNDNCTANPTVAFVSDASDGNACPEIITRTYSITDDCGNQTLITQTITINDDIAPTGDAPADIAVQCIDDVPLADITLVTNVNDNCTVNPTVAFVSDASDGNACPEIITRTYSITDDCGNQTLITQTITVNDDIAPTGDAPADIAVQCIDDVPVADITLVTNVNDNCTANPTVAFVSDASDGNACPEIITRTYSITDDCGNQTLVTQTITVNDTTDPTASNPADIVVPGGPVPAPDPSVVTDAADNCTITPLVEWVSDTSDGEACPETITRIYSVTDDCGNQITVTQLILITDPFPPTASNPAPIAVQCIGDVPAPDPAVVTDADDNSGVAIVTWEDDTSNGQTCPEIITRRYRVTDDCGNFILVEQTITINDDIAPTGDAPADIAVQCIDDVPLADITLVTNVNDNCTVNPTVAFVSDASDGNACPEIITRTYSITDDCGNQTLITQTITVNDDIAPTGDAPADIAVQCIDDVPVADITLVTNVNDNCTANPTVAFVSDASDGNACPEIITRTYSITDDCGNQTLVTQTITVNDTTDPTASNPADIVVPGGPVPAPDPSVVTDAADNCTITPLVEWVSDTSDGEACPETITRIYSVTDDCGNQITVTQLILITDPFPPTASNPAPIAVQCIGDVPAPDPAVVTDADDNSGVAIVTWEDDTSNGQTCPEIITRRYRVTDDCGNFILVEQTITINDDIAPTGDAPADIAVQCIDDVPLADITLVTNVNDNCTVNPTVAFVSDASDGNACPEIITRTYSITDDCGNQTLITQTITVNDDIAPTGDAPADIAVQCIDDVPVADITLVTNVNDNCTANPTVAFVSDASDGNACPEIITRTYSITDDCGNQTLVTQTITVNDTTDPTASNPADIVAPGGPVPAPDPSVVTDAADNCTITPLVEWVSDTSDGEACPETITRIYSVTDDCGNQITVTQLILITDPFPPTASNPAPIAVQCIGDVPAPDPAVVTDADDNSGVAIVTWEDDTSNGQTCPEIITRRYRVTDDCGNFILVEQTITINDDIAPTGDAPADITVACPSDVPAADINSLTGVSDNCTVNPLVVHEGDATDGNICNGEVIIRAYSITDDCGNQTIVTQTITIDAVTPTFTLTSTHPTDCGTPTGTITINGLNPNTTYELGFNGNPVTTITTDAAGNYVITNLPAGSYSPLTVQPIGCPDCGTTNNTIITLTDPNAPFIDAGPDQTVCAGTPTTLTATNPDGANISWNNGISDGTPFTQAIGSVTYNVTAELNNCFSSDNVTITVNPIPNVSAGNDLIICNGETVILTGSGATTYTWDNGVTNGVSFTPAQTTTYTVTGTTNGCSAQDEMTVYVNPTPEVTFAVDDYEGCVPVTVNLTNTTSNVNSENCVWTIQNGPTLNGCDVSHTFNNGGCYAVTLTVTSDIGCTASATYPNFICVDNYPVANFGVSPLFLTSINNEATFTNGSIGAVTYEWDFGDGNSSNETNPTHTYTDDGENLYDVQLIAYSAQGCPDTAYTVIEMREELVFYVPNTFTPDNNGMNEVFLPIFTSGFDPYDYNLLIFNRWGEIVFESYNHQIGWDGTYRGKLVQDGTYVWKIEFKTKYTDERKVHTGHINVLK
jgi:gliding motility-associated-like protein